MLRSPLPRTIEYLPALVHEHIVCEVPITNREWAMEPGHLKLPSGKLVNSSAGSVHLADYSTYKRRISQWERDCLNRGDPSGFKLHADLKHLLRGELWEGAKGTTQTSPLAEAIAMQVQRLLKEGRRPGLCEHRGGKGTLPLCAAETGSDNSGMGGGDGEDSC